MLLLHCCGMRCCQTEALVVYLCLLHLQLHLQQLGLQSCWVHACSSAPAPAPSSSSSSSRASPLWQQLSLQHLEHGEDAALIQSHAFCDLLHALQAL
jgi:hypothetical protein